MTLVIVVEDDPHLRRTLDMNLRARGFDVELAGTGEDAVKLAGRRPPDLMLLDLGLPGMDGMEVIGQLREWATFPIVVLSARGAEGDKVRALDVGANDYLTKPFGVEELMARVRASLRTHGVNNDPIVTDDFRLDLDERTLSGRGGEPIHLTPIEWGLLQHLARADGRLVTQRTLLTAVWGPEYADETNYLRVHLTHLRHKLEPDSSAPRYIVTEPGVGYRFRR